MATRFDLGYLVLCALVLAAGLVSGQVDDTAERTVSAGDLGDIIGLKPYTTTTPIRPFYMFHSIPYAKPTGETARFKPSVVRTGPLTEDGKPFLALNPLNACPQGGTFDIGKFDMDDGSSGETNLLKVFKSGKWNKFNFNPTVNASKRYAPIPGSEEDENTCLVLNVNTPKIPRTAEDAKKLLPVILFIHGGSSTSVWGAPFNGFRMLSRDVVLISINYRLGVLGAFNLGTDDAPGNAAMYDCITALKWVQKYIHHFGGDPKRVTVYGHSAGAMMATHLLLSPLAKGLMSGVIGSSGSALAVWGTSIHPSIDIHLKIAEYSGCYTAGSAVDKPAIVACMQKKPVEILLDALSRYSNEDRETGGLGFDAKIPSIQSPDLTIPIFLAKDPNQILLNGEQNNIPLIMGSNRHDGSFAFEDIYNKFIKDKIDDEDWMRNELMPELLKAMRLEDESGVFQHTLGLTYMGDEVYHSGKFWPKLAGLIDITSVFAFKAGGYRTVELHSKVNPNSYYYAFEHQGFWSTYDMSAESVIPGGIAHIEDMLYPFQAFPLITKGDLGVANRMVDYFVNFATYGNPNGKSIEVTFPPYNPFTHEFLIINKTDAIGVNCRDTWAGNALEIAAVDVLPTQPIGVKP